MINERESGDVSRQSFSDEPFDPRQGEATALIGAGFAGALLGGAVVWLLRSLRISDEPPIRVKGGSMHLDVLSSSVIWVPDGSSGKIWRLSSGTRSKEEYDVPIITSSTHCLDKSPSGHRVRFEFTEGKVVRWVELRAPGKTTKVMASDPLGLTNSKQRLTLGGTGYISRITVGNSVCEFSSANELDHALLMDF